MIIFKKSSIILKYFLFMYMFARTYYLYHSRISIMLLLFFLITLLMVNDYLRGTKIPINSKSKRPSSLLVTIFISSVLTYFVKGFGSYFYLFYPLEEILPLKGAIQKILFSIHFLLYIILVITDIGISTNLDKILLLLLIILLYFFMANSVYSSMLIREEKEKINELNHKLQIINIKLKQYALEVEESTASKERTIVSQIFHDSLGHSLMALIMHLEFIEKMYSTKPEEVKEIIIKSRTIAKSSIISLREAVDLLNKRQRIKPFNNTIKDIIDTYCMLNKIKINFHINKNLDSLNLLIKNSMFNVINEFISNSIKHGNATEIDIKVSIGANIISFILTDNGVGCNKIIKSNGLLEIENRITSLNGSVNYFSNNNFGFGIDISIPILADEVYRYRSFN